MLTTVSRAVLVLTIVLGTALGIYGYVQDSDALVTASYFAWGIGICLYLGLLMARFKYDRNPPRRQ